MEKGGGAASGETVFEREITLAFVIVLVTVLFITNGNSREVIETVGKH